MNERPNTKSSRLPPVLRHLLLLAALLSSDVDAAFVFVIEKHEWMTWAEHCRVRYVGSDAGKKSDFVGAYSRAEQQRWANKIGGNLWAHMHHACAGVVWLQRAKNMSQGIERDRAMSKAVSNHLYTLTRASNENRWYAWFAISLSQVYRELEEYDAAMELISAQVEAYPDYDRSYLAWSLVLRDQEKYEEAAVVLVDAVEKTGGTSAEIWYFLGLTLTDLGRYEDAVKPAVQAYRLHYPLEGLKNRLRRAGVWEGDVKTFGLSEQSD
jgi:tetratricopeptide (TPR) repeat protein